MIKKFDIEKLRALFDKKIRIRMISISAALLLSGGFFTYRIFSNVKADAESLLPSGSRVMKDMREARERLPSVDSLLMFVTSGDAGACKRFTADFAEKLKSSEHSVIARVVYNIKDDIDFFTRNSSLYYPIWEIQELEEALFPPSAKDKWINNWKRRLERFKEKFDRKIDREEKYSLFKYLKYLPEGDLSSRDGTTRAILIFYSKPMSDVKDAIDLDRFINKTIEEMNPVKYAGDIQFRFSGLAYTLMNEYYALWDDIILSSILTTALLILLVFSFYKTIRIVIPLCYMMILMTVITFAIAYFAFSELNANSAFMASIIIGNGINPGIVFCSYYLNEMKRKRNTEESILYAVKMSFVPTFIATLATTVVFGSLILSESKGFFDFGIIGLWGMFAGWLCTFLFMPSILSLKIFQLKDDFLDKYEMPLKKPWEKITTWIYNNGRRLSIGFAALFVASCAYLLLYNYEFLERDTTKVRSRDYVNTNFINFQRYLSKIKLKKEMFPSLLILTDTMEDALKLQRNIELDMELRRIEKDIMAFTIHNIIPLNQEEKIKQISNIKRKAAGLPDDMSGVRLSRRKEDLFNAILDTDINEPVTIEKLPQNLKDYFTELDGSLGKMVFISVDINKLERDIYRMIAFIDRIKAVSRQSLGENKYNVSGLVPISTELAKIMIKDASRCIKFAFGAMIFVFLISYRKLRLFSMMTLNFCFAMGIFIAIMPLFGIKINFLNFIAIPMAFGIGVDYSTNIVHGALERGGGSESIKTSLIMTGPSVIVASLCTQIGYASLIYTKTIALSSFGTLCIIGEMITLAGAFAILPGLFSFFYGGKAAEAGGSDAK